jgi:hypothetical protein
LTPRKNLYDPTSETSFSEWLAKLPEAEGYALRVRFNGATIVRLSDEMPLGTKQQPTKNEGLVLDTSPIVLKIRRQRTRGPRFGRRLSTRLPLRVHHWMDLHGRVFRRGAQGLPRVRNGPTRTGRADRGALPKRMTRKCQTSG